MTATAQDDEIFLAISSRLAPANDVMNLELIAPTTVLTLPMIALENFLRELAVRREIEPKPPSFANAIDHADRLMSHKNFCCCDIGRDPKSRSSEIRSASELSFSRFAPARKSAQIISRQ